MAMVSAALTSEERKGLLVALALHGAVIAALLLQPAAREAMPLPERMTVSLAEEVGLAAEAPDPVADSRAAEAPVLSPEPAPAPVPEPAPPQPSSVKRVQPPVPVPSRAAPARPARKPPATRTGGGSRIGDNFLEGAGSSTATSETRVPASRIGASAKASIAQAVARQIKPHWTPPNGPEVDRIVSFVRFRLKPDGTLDGRPTLARQTGVNDTNRAQADRHAEQAIRAVVLAAPFDLPGEYYEAWKSVTANLDWRLAQ